MEKVYVKVGSVIDTTGFMQLKTIYWPDGRLFQIQNVRDFRPLKATETGQKRDCYTVVVKGQERQLFFEQARSVYSAHFGRWYVERDSIEPAAVQKAVKIKADAEDAMDD